MGEKTLMKGNEALSEGAVRAGCRFFSGYPITPQNEIPEYLAWRLPEVNGVFVQAESETAAINMLYGAASTGVRTMTSSSSPGISLKLEGISYCAGADLPIFFVNVVRGGPGLGNIAGAQSDYFQSVKGGGHGDYRVITLAPNSVHEMGNFPRKCYELAEKYRMPAMILADGILGQMMEPVEFEDEQPVDLSKRAEPAWALGNSAGRAKRVVSSYDLREGELEKLVNARAERYHAVEENEVLWEEHHTERMDILLVAYGTSSRACLEALHYAKEKGLSVGLFRPITLWPFPYRQLAAAAGRAKAVLTVEMSLGQMVEDVRLAVNGSVPVHLHARPGGGLPTGADIVAQAEKILAKQSCSCGGCK
ncbi:MAG: 3-methyl-2-oxobutanoate dehydrogenase subunit VorB [Elusimicrobiaceae bacterium]